MSHRHISKTQTAKSESLHPTKVSCAPDAWRTSRHFSPEMNFPQFEKKKQLGWWGTTRTAQHIMTSSLSWICEFLVWCKANDSKKKYIYI